MTESIKDIGVGDYVYFQYGKKQEYPAKVVEKQNADSYRVEVCLNKKKSEGNDVEVMDAKRSQLRHMFG